MTQQQVPHLVSLRSNVSRASRVLELCSRLGSVVRNCVCLIVCCSPALAGTPADNASSHLISPCNVVAVGPGSDMSSG